MVNSMDHVLSRRFGVELEMVGLDTESALRILRKIEGIPFSEGTHYRHNETDVWKVVTDSSIDYGGIRGCEIVSPILSGVEDLKTLMRVVQAFSDVATVNRRCGLHVHVDASDLSSKKIRHIVGRYARFEKGIDAFMPRSRRDSENEFCGSVIKQLELIGRNSAYADRWYSEDPARTCESLGSRFVKVNLESYERYKTIEFRQHSGTLNVDKVRNWVNFVLQFVEQSICHLPEDVYEFVAPVCAPAPVPTPVPEQRFRFEYGRTMTKTMIIAHNQQVDDYRKLIAVYPHMEDATAGYYCHSLVADLNSAQTYILQELFERRNSYVTLNEIARHVATRPYWNCRNSRHITDASIVCYISGLRKMSGLKIKNSRTRGYMLVSESRVAAAEAPVVSTSSVSIEASGPCQGPAVRRIGKLPAIPKCSQDTLWSGITPDLQKFYAERAVELE